MDELDVKLEKFKYGRLKKQKKLNLLSQLPANKLREFDVTEKKKAAVKIQSVWRGYIARKKINENKNLMKKERSAKIIQKWVKKWLKQTKQRNIMADLMELDVDKERIKEIQQEIDEWRKTNPLIPISYEDKHEIHYKVQEKLNEYHLTRKNNLYQDQTHLKLLDQLNSDVQHLSTRLNNKLTLPELGHLSATLDQSKPIKIRAKIEHETALESARKPWRRKYQTFDAF